MKSELSAEPPAARWSRTGWALALAAVSVLLVGAVLPPVVGPSARAVVLAAFDGFCHQLPERSFALGGVPFAVCHRCTGTLAGLTAGVLALPMLRSWVGSFARSERAWLLAAVLPVALDWSGGALGLWESAAARVATGLWFGVVAGLVFARALAVRRVRETGERSPVPSVPS